jgi:hypothetical protein
MKFGSSPALDAAWVSIYESNKGAQVWFLADSGELIAKLNRHAKQ